ncbi:MAG: cytochrome-c peroxidase, partial [Pseudomonadota bacterium]
MLRPLIAAALAALLAAPAAAEPATPRLPPAAFAPIDPALARLGQLLFYDPILSGNRNIACATCHHPRLATADGVSVSLGEGAAGLGPDRRPDPANTPEQRLPRNAPALFNLGAAEFTVMFHDGRVEADPARPSGYRSPLEEALPQGLSTALAAQAMFPVTSPDEMAGHYGENEVSKAVRLGLIAGPGGAWDLLARRVDAIPAYAEAFAAAIPDTAARPLRFADIAEALAAFMAFEWRADDSPFDRALAGDAPLPTAAAEGMALFYGAAGCAACHSGRFQTDHGFHAMAAPQIGPGKAARYETHARDLGRHRVTGRPEDAYAFRT